MIEFACVAESYSGMRVTVSYLLFENNRFQCKMNHFLSALTTMLKQGFGKFHINSLARF